MKISESGFLVLNLPGIDLFVSIVEKMAEEGGFADGTPLGCMKELQADIHRYRDFLDNTTGRKAVTCEPGSPLTLPLRELMDRRICRGNKLKGVARNVVYIVRHDDAVLYVGSSRYDARTRLKAHEHAHSPLGDALRQEIRLAKFNQDASWTVEMIPHATYEEAFQKEKKLTIELAPRFCRKI